MSKWIKRIGGLTLVCLLGLAAAYPVADLLKRHLNADTRAQLVSSGEAHSFVPLSDGITHYRLEGTPTRGTVVLIHGVLNSSQIYESYFQPLTTAGYRVLSYDFYGRGYTDRPSLDYTPELMDHQLVELLDKLGIDGKVNIAGFTMGGPIGAIFAERHPERVASLTLMAASGLDEKHELGRQTMPVIGDWFYRVLGPWELEGFVLSNAQALPDPMSHLRDYRKWSRFAGHEDAVLSTLRHYPFYAIRAHYAAVAKLGIPVFAIWGTEDKVYPLKQTETLKQLIPTVRVRTVVGGGHSIVYGEPAIVAAMLIEFLDSV